jgi:uncharacterized protein (UPF0335 family)
MSRAGHNKPPKVDAKDPAQARELIASYVKRKQNIAERKRKVADEDKDLTAEIKSSGLDPKTIGTVLAELEFIEFKGRDAFQAKQATLDLYRDAAGVTLGDDE